MFKITFELEEKLVLKLIGGIGRCITSLPISPKCKLANNPTRLLKLVSLPISNPLISTSISAIFEEVNSKYDSFSIWIISKGS